MRELERLSRETARLSEAAFFPSIPRVEKKSDSFPVKGVPKVTVNGRGCSVTVRGWDRQEVQYNVTQFTDVRNRQPIVVKETHGDSEVNISVTNPEDNDDESRPVRIEVFVPRKSNLKIDASGTIRLDGVSGDLQVIGDDQSIDVRDSDGKLNVSNTDGQVRIIGFKGELIAKTVDGSVRMDGDFTSIIGKAEDGTFLLTVPSDIDADITGSGEDFTIEVQEMSTGKQISENNWRFGKGSRKYSFASMDGTLVVQNRNSLVADNQ
jgi:PKD repeat protein